MSKPKFLFLCTGNSARSQMGEAFLRAYAGEHFDVYSAGLEPKGEILPVVRRVMAEIGLNMEGQYSKSVNEYLGKFNFAYTVTVCGGAEEKCPRIFLSMGKHMFWPFDDPAALSGSEEEILAQTRQIRDAMAEKIRSWLLEQGIQPADLKI
ncbi:MAG: arsenate reductase ArsC [Anaerolineales bacterium]|nr:arsenate reductase ArsC [Anaerolineales bacterium]MCX7754111.1 arsenate reductase ArsC [Anaerolineales bacterium]MDW8278653.1 arsenate reductase ArsC [Anaerolineales bacterium]